MRRMRHPSHVVSIAVYDAVPDQQRLLAATLYGLGCRTMPLDCGSAAPDKLAAQLADTPPDVLVWHLGEPKVLDYLAQIGHRDPLGAPNIDSPE